MGKNSKRTGSVSDFLDYAVPVIAEMSRMADRHGLGFGAYLLAMSSTELSDIRKQGLDSVDAGHGAFHGKPTLTKKLPRNRMVTTGNIQ